VRRFLIALPLISALAIAAACDDSTGPQYLPILVGDTVEIAAPIDGNAAPIDGNEELPNALDITGDGAGGVYGGRFTDRQADVLQWDFAIRFREGKLALLPPGALDILSAASLTRALEGQTFTGLEQAPSQSQFVDDEPVFLIQGAIYAARSRNAVSAFGTTCPQFAKIEAIEVDQVTGRARLGIVTNERCGDPRLVPVE
jgi:hypothetical protein